MVILAAALAAAPVPSYRSVSVDSAGQLRIELDSGTVEKAPLLEYQVRFGDPAISPDRRTVGWLVLYPYPDPDMNREPIAGKLVVYRDGRILHTFPTEPIAWDWGFVDGGRQVAYSTGPTHGGATECFLRDVESGKLLETWLVKEGKEAPAWARGLRV